MSRRECKECVARLVEGVACVVNDQAKRIAERRPGLFERDTVASQVRQRLGRIPFVLDIHRAIVGYGAI